MSSLSDLPEVVGFFSYSREDDDAFKGSLSALRDGIQRELSAQLGRTKRNFRLWQDQEGIAPGRLWESEIKAAVEQAVFFIPIVTPRAVNSENCQIEYGAFLQRERELGRTDLVFPILYIGVPALENEAQWRNHPVLSVVGKRQYVDWRQFRHQDIQTTAVREAIERFCGKIVEALNRPLLSSEELDRPWGPEDRQRLQAAEEQARRSKDEVEAQRIAEERRRAEAEAERRVQEEKARSQAEAEAEAQRRAGEETKRKRDDAEAQRIAEEQGQQQAEAERTRKWEEDRIPTEKDTCYLPAGVAGPRTTAPAPSNMTFLQVVCALLLLQGIGRAGYWIDWYYNVHMQQFDAAAVQDSLVFIGWAAAPVIIAFGIARQIRWVRALGLIAAGIGALIDAGYYKSVTVWAKFGIDSATAIPLILSVVIDVVVIIYFIRFYRPVPRTA
jgi:hypothetical protein